MRLLALDLSTHVGWAFFAQRDARPQLGTWRVGDVERGWARRGLYGPMYFAYEAWLLQQIERRKPELIAFEAPILPRGPRMFQKARAIRMSYGFAEITERLAFIRQVRCLEAHPSTVKVRLGGTGKADKNRMIASATRLGHEVEDHHQADAIGVALTAFDHVEPPQRELVLP